MISVFRRFADGLTNVLTGLGTTSDPRYASHYRFTALEQAQIEAAYRGSGLMRKVVDIPAFDMVREGRDWQADKDQIELLEAEEKRLGIWGKVMLAEIYRGLGGGALILGGPGDMEMPLSERIGKKQLAFVNVVSRWQIQGEEWIDDLTDPAFGHPKLWRMTLTQGQQRLHPSRVVCFRGDPVPNLGGADWEEQFWGESRVQRVLDAVQNSDTAQAAFANLITKARNTIVGIPGLTDLVSTTAGEGKLTGRLATMIRAESLFNVTLRDAGDGTQGAGETIDHRQVTWAGIPDIMYAFAAFVAAVSDIPVTRLLGKAAEGMNASGDSQQKDWNKMVKARQTLMLAPCLDQLDAALIPSALGTRPAEVWWQFAPLDTPSEAEEATRFKSTMEAIEKAQNTGAIPDRAFAEGFQNLLIENGWLPGIEGPLNDMGEDERYGIEPRPDATDPGALVATVEPEESPVLPAKRAANDKRSSKAPS